MICLSSRTSLPSTPPSTTVNGHAFSQQERERLNVKRYEKMTCFLSTHIYNPTTEQQKTQSKIAAVVVIVVYGPF
jgi:hypothetical protein